MEVMFTSKLGGKQGRKAWLLRALPAARDDSQVEPSRELRQLPWNFRPHWACFTNSQGPVSSGHEVRTQPVFLCF